MQKSKHKLILFSLLALSIVIGVLSWHLDYTYASTLGDLIGQPLAQSIGSLIATFCRVIYDMFIEPILMPTVKAMLHFGITASDILINGTGFGGIDAIWGQLLGIANGVYLLALFIASIAIILRVNVAVYNVKKFLGGFITAVILSNLSLYIVRAVWSIGELLVSALLKMAETLTPLISNREQIEEFLRTLANQPLPEGVDATANVLVTLGTLINTILLPGVGLLSALPGMYLLKDSNQQIIISFLVLLICVWFILKLALVLFERVIRLFLLAITAPVIFALGLLPNFSKLTSQWWENLIKWVLVWPAVLALIIFSAYMLSFAGVQKPDEANKISLWLNPLVVKEVINTGEGLNTEAGMGFMGVLLALFALWTAGSMNKTLNLGSVIAGHVESPQKALQTGQGLYKKGADILTGKAAGPTKAIQDTMAGKNLVGMAGLGIKRQALAGKLGGKYADWVQEKTANLQAAYTERTFATQGAKKEAASKKAVLEATAHRGVIGGRTHLKALDKAANNEYGKTYFELEGDEKATFKKRHKNLIKQYDDANASTSYNVSKVISEEDSANWDSPKQSDKIIRQAAEKAKDKNDMSDLGPARVEIEKLRHKAYSNARNIDLGEREESKKILEGLANDRILEKEYGLNPRKYFRDYDATKSGGSGGGDEIGATSLISALNNLSGAITNLGGGLHLDDSGRMDSFSEATKNTDARDMAIALRRLSASNVSAGTNSDRVVSGIDLLEGSTGDGTKEETIKALRELVARGFNVGSLADQVRGAADGSNSMQALINNLQTIQNVANVSINPAFQSSISTWVNNQVSDGYARDKQVAFDDLNTALDTAVSAIQSAISRGEPTTSTAATVLDENDLLPIMGAFESHLVSISAAAGHRVTPENITLGQIADLVSKASVTAKKIDPSSL